MVKAGIKIAIFLGLAGLVSFLIIVAAKADENEPVNIKDKKITISQFSQLDLNTDGESPLSSTSEDQLTLGGRGGGFEPERVYISPEMKTEFAFNAIGVHWQYQAEELNNIKIEIRVSDGEIWNDWQILESESFISRDDNSAKEENENKETYSDLVFVENGQKFQYRVSLETDNLEITPKLDEIEFEYIDSIDGPKAPEFESGWFKKANAAETITQGVPKIISRTEWGCPQGETSPEWPPESASKTYHVFHHTATTNGAEPYSMVRAIWQYQYNRTWEGGIWGDIGYNYLVDQYGHIFKGRNGPANVIGAHVYGHNTHSIGVTILGDYRYVNPSSSALSGLSTIIGYSGAATGMSKIRLYGHRELDATTCPGDKLFAKKSSILSSASQKLTLYTPDDIARYDGEIYYRNGSDLLKIPSSDIFGNWGFRERDIRDINETEFNSYSLGPDLGYFGKKGYSAFMAVGGGVRIVNTPHLPHWGINVDDLPDLTTLIDRRPRRTRVYDLGRSYSRKTNYYLPGGGKKQIVTQAVKDERVHYDRKYRDIPTVSTALLDQYQNWGYLSFRDNTYPKPVVRYQDKLYYHERNYVRLIPTRDIFANWGFSEKDIRNISQDEFESYLLAHDLDYFVRNDTQAYLGVHGRKKKISSGCLTLFGESWAGTVINRGLLKHRPTDGGVSSIVKSPQINNYFYLMSTDKKKIVYRSVFKNRGYYGGNYSKVDNVSTALLDRLPTNGYVFYKNGTLIRRIGGASVYYMESEKKRPISGEVFASWNYKSSQILDVAQTIVDLIPTGYAWPPKKISTLLGPYGSPVYLPAYSGKTAREQHLWLISNETASHHYSVSGTPVSCQNGMAGGFGAFGSAASISQERYYINMRWNYCTWYEEDGITKVKNCDPVLKSWHRHKKLIVTNPDNGKSVVVSIEEAGPQIWTGRVSGLSPEAMLVIGAVTNDNLTYYWIGSQSVPLGPIN